LLKQIRNYANKHGVKLVEHRDGRITLRRKSTKRPTTSTEDFMKRFSQPLKVIGSDLKKLGYDYISSPHSFNFNNYPVVTALLTYQLNRLKGENYE
jgi:hypothetical protein